MEIAVIILACGVLVLAEDAFRRRYRSGRK